MNRLPFYSAALLASLLLAAPASGVNIVWVTPHATGPSGPAVTAGFTEAPDIGYTNLLTAAGHSVTRLLAPAAANNAAVPPADLATMNAADLVILSRSIVSGVFDNVNEINSWNTQVTKPMILISGYATRNNRLGLTTGATIPDITGPTRLVVSNPAHPIFAGVPLNGSNETGTILDRVTAPIAGNPLQRGTSINTNPIVTGGTLLASITSDAPTGLPGGMVIAEFPAGTASSFAGGGTFASKRLTFITGSREPDGGNSDIAGILDLSADGQTMFKNAVCYMVGSCQTLVLGDTDGDGIVEYPEDFNPIRANFRKLVSTRAMGDLTGDGRVDFADFRQWKTGYLSGSGTSLDGIDLGFLASVPEPSSALLLLIAIGGVVARRIRH